MTRFWCRKKQWWWGKRLVGTVLQDESGT